MAGHAIMSAEAPAWCGRCGQPLARLHGTAYVRCTRTVYCGREYWTTVPAATRDTMRQPMYAGPQRVFYWYSP
jgi:hypothetical protein